MKSRILTMAAASCSVVLLLTLCPMVSMAQYQVFMLEDMEKGGAFPNSLIMKHQASPSSVSVIDYTSPSAPAGILDGAAKTECGRYGLLFQTSTDAPFLSVLNALTLDRKRLGAKGKALYQADFYIPAEGGFFPNIAVLAVVPMAPDKKDIWQLYRLGVIAGSRIYFSYANNTGQPIIYVQESINTLNIKRPGWHRFQIVFEGQDQIICAVDGKPTQFSPVKEGTFDQLQPGIMVTSTGGVVGSCIADNLSIQWTPEEAPLPDSPWYTAIEATPVSPLFAEQGPAPGQIAPAAPPTPAQPQWLTSHEDAWQKCLAENRPILVLFYVPRTEATQKVQQMFLTDPASQEVLRQLIPLQIDANQLAGGVLAQKFNVYKVPAFIVIGPDRKEWARAVVGKTTEWSTVLDALRKAAPPK